MTGLGDLPGGGFFSFAIGVSADGSVVVGRSDSSNGTEAFIWDEDSQTMQSIADLLIADAIDLPGMGWNNLYQASAISADGLTVVGIGTHNGNPEAWMATRAAPVPLPAAVWLFGSALLGLIGCARKKIV